jgi:hypothetical protein
MPERYDPISKKLIVDPPPLQSLWVLGTPALEHIVRDAPKYARYSQDGSTFTLANDALELHYHAKHQSSSDSLYLRFKKTWPRFQFGGYNRDADCPIETMACFMVQACAGEWGEISFDSILTLVQAGPESREGKQEWFDRGRDILIAAAEKYGFRDLYLAHRSELESAAAAADAQDIDN